MTILKGRISAMAALTALLSATLINAAPQATFHLPMAARWGGALLQPGDYKILLPSPSTGSAQFRVEGMNKRAFEMPLVANADPNLVGSKLTLQMINGEYFVREFSSGECSKSFVFSVPKANAHQQLAESTRPSAVTVPVN